MLKISWTEFASNEKVLGQQVKDKRWILTPITRRHTVRDNSLKELILEGKIDGSSQEGDRERST